MERLHNKRTVGWHSTIALFFGGLVLLTLLGLGKSSAQNVEQGNFIKSDTINIYKVNSLIIPVLGYSPTTQLAYGGGGQFFFRTKGSDRFSRISNILGTIIFTTESQMMIDGATQLYFKNERYFLDGKFTFKKFPNLFYGVGNDTKEEDAEQYDMNILEVHASFLKRLPSNVNFGFKYSYRKYDMKEFAEGGELEKGEILGSEGALLHSVGMVLNIDSRDDYLTPSKGVFLQFTSNFTSRVIGSNYAFNEFIFDLRKFFKITERSVVGTQGYMHFTMGDVPFQAMPQMGGSNLNRGFRKGRYRDENMYALQAEYRYKLTKRVKLAGFISTGEVSSNPRNFFSQANYSYGGGLRWQIKKNNRAQIRLDYGLGRGNSSGFYFAVNEAF